VDTRYSIPEDDPELLAECDITYFRSSGPGGQHKNKTLTAVRLKHRPTGTVCIGKRSRSQYRNRVDALKRLREKLLSLLTPRKPRRPTRPSEAAKRKRLEEKRRRARLKRFRTKVRGDEE